MGCACNNKGGTAVRAGRTGSSMTSTTVVATAKLPAPLPKNAPIKVERKGVRVARDVDKYRG